MRLTGVLEASVYVDDLDAATGFYGKVLGLEQVARAEGRHVFFRCGRSVVLCFVPEETCKLPTNPAVPVPPHGAQGAGHVCFAAPRAALDGWRARLEASGVGIEADFEWPHGARSIYVRDPAGNSVEIAEPGLWSLDETE